MFAYRNIRVAIFMCDLFLIYVKSYFYKCFGIIAFDDNCYKVVLCVTSHCEITCFLL